MFLGWPSSDLFVPFFVEYVFNCFIACKKPTVLTVPIEFAFFNWSINWATNAAAAVPAVDWWSAGFGGGGADWNGFVAVVVPAVDEEI
jgi:hypothetical protein